MNQPIYYRGLALRFNELSQECNLNKVDVGNFGSARLLLDPRGRPYSSTLVCKKQRIEPCDRSKLTQ